MFWILISSEYVVEAQSLVHGVNLCACDRVATRNPCNPGEIRAHERRTANMRVSRGFSYSLPRVSTASCGQHPQKGYIYPQNNRNTLNCYYLGNNIFLKLQKQIFSNFKWIINKI